MRLATPLLLLALLVGTPLAVHAQSSPSAEAEAMGDDAERPAPDPADVASVDAILTAVYASISGPTRAPRQWDRFLSLFYPGARLMPTAPLPDGRDTVLVWTPEQYMQRSGGMLVASGFSEGEVARQVVAYGPVTHAFSAYDGSYTGRDGGTVEVRGINSFQLMHDGNRWWIMSIFWAAENPSRPLPDWAQGE